MHARRQRREESRQRAMRVRPVDVVSVVQHQQPVAWQRRQFSREGRGQRLDGRLRGHLQCFEQRSSSARLQRTARRDEVHEQHGRVTVILVKRQPDRRPRTGCGPRAQQRGLAKARGRRHEDQPATQAAVKPLEQARARHVVSPHRWDEQASALQRILL
jgi:hypothetical protein